MAVTWKQKQLSSKANVIFLDISEFAICHVVRSVQREFHSKSFYCD